MRLDIRERCFAGDPGKDNRPSATATSTGGPDVKQLLETFHPQLLCDEDDRASWFYFYRDEMRKWAFYTDARTFKERLNLAADRDLQGFCSWVLGQEDPAIWDALPQHS